MTDLQDDELLREYLATIAGEERWEESLEEYSVNLLHIKPGKGLAVKLESNGQYEAAYQDEQAVIYLHKPL
jgi:hypothetical protein